MAYINKEDLLATINEAWERKYADCKCSVCGAICNVHVSAGIPTQRYCYRCGAKMLED